MIWYLLACKLFMDHPSLLHTKRTKFQMVEKGIKYSHHLIAHRGGGWDAPENTMQAFRKAVELNCHMLEMDVHMTKDKQLVICHDKDLLRVCGDKRNVSEVNFADLPKLSKSFKMQQHHAIGMSYKLKP